MGLWVIHVEISRVIGNQLFGAAEQTVRILLNAPDMAYNIFGAVGIIRDETTSETKAVNPIMDLYMKFNSVVRLPIFTAGVGLVGKSGIDLFNHVTNGKPIDSNGYNCLMYGIGLLSLASSMYIKNTDPKLLQKEPLWKKTYNWCKENAGSLIPHPLPQPVPVRAYSTLEDYI